MSLDGEWEIAEGDMCTAPAQFSHHIPVPGLVDMARPPFSEVGVPSKQRKAFWYRKSFEIPRDVPTVAQLKIRKAMLGTRVLLNGQEIGEHVPSFTPGLFDVHDYLHGNHQKNELVIRVGADSAVLPKTVPNGFDFEKKRYLPGIYDSVELILTGAPHINLVQVAPDLEGSKVRVAAELTRTAPADGELAYTILEAKSGRVVVRGSTPFSNTDSASTQTVDFTIPLTRYQPWSPEKPFLYELELATRGDKTRTRFGMRSFRLDQPSGRAMLNGHPYFLRGTNVCILRFFEDATRGDKPWRSDWVRRLHRVFKEMNWNCARYCIGFPPEKWYDIADEEGFLIQDEFPIWYGKNVWPADLKSDELVREYTEWMHERWNHPSVVIWDAQNETVTSQTGLAIQAVRGLDLSDRPWDNGWSAPQDPRDSFEVHNYMYSNGEPGLGRLGELKPGFAHNPAKNKFHNPMIINEYGWIWLTRQGEPCTLATRVYAAAVGTSATPEQRREWCARTMAAKSEYWRAQRCYAGIMHFCGLGYSREDGQTSDNFVDVANLVLEPHFARYVRDAFSPVGVVLNIWDEQVPPGRLHEAPVIVLNDLDTTVSGTVKVSVKRDRTEVRKASLACLTGPYGKSTLTFPLPEPMKPGKYRIAAELAVPGRKLVSSLRDVEVLSPEKLGFAFGKPASASSSVTVDDRKYLPEYAFDGDHSTRWSSEFSEPQWIAADLLSTCTISRAELIWERACAKEYAIEVSGDGQSWTEVYRTNASKGGHEQVKFAPVPARWVRLTGLKRATEFGFSLIDFRVLP